MITLEELNGRITEFDYGYTEKSSKPTLITERHILDANEGLKQSAAQMQHVAMLPLIISDKVPQGCLPLENYLKMIEIILILHEERVDLSMLDYLDCCISEYLELIASSS